MSALPSEILDLIVDDLYDEPDTVKSCCVVSKSWIPRARKHLFAYVEFHSFESPVEWWKEAFPDPSNSPAHHTRTLSIYNISLDTAADEVVGDLIKSFRNVVNLQLSDLDLASLTPLHGLSPTVRSLDLAYIPFEIFDLVCSFPLLEDLSLAAPYARCDTGRWNPSPTSPKLTGSLDLRAGSWTRSFIRRLLELPDGLHFSKITLEFFEGDAESVTDLVSGCSDTLESLTMAYCPPSTSSSTPVTG